ncbi:hypothetical protein [Azospirillum sp.]|uniref:hypothetical protein n=1 Tax=Azospirillum sp. TaxID=34012 RepID=UPI003D70D305
MSLFTKDTAVPDLRNDRLMRLGKGMRPDAAVSDDYLWGKLLAAEKLIERQLRVFLTPREIVPLGASWVTVPAGTPQAEIDALTASGKEVFTDGTEVLEEPGYDYDPDLWRGNTWGLIELRQKPIIKVHSITFAYPSPSSKLFSIPTEWIRPDKKYGRISLVPVQGAVTLPMNTYLLSTLGGGRLVPLMLQVRYSAGLTNVEVEHPDIADVIKKAAVLSVVDDKYLPQSASASVDGLSQSLSWDAEKYRDAIDKKVATIRDSLQGIRVMVM